MKITSTVRSYPVGYKPPQLPEGIASCDSLAELLLHYRRYEIDSPVSMVAPVSDQRTRQLIELAFWASMAPEEGRFPRFKIECRNASGSFFMIARFEPIRLDHVDSLRKLAPACTHPDCALLITERDEQLWCDGVINVGPMGYDTLPGRPEFKTPGSPPNFQVDVRGPGHIVAGSGLVSYEFRAGRVRQLCPFWLIPVMNSLRDDVSRHLEQELSSKEGQDAERFFGGSRHSLPIFPVLTRMFRIAADAGHGGAFVIIPTESRDCDEFDVAVKYDAYEPDVGHDLASFWSSCAAAARKLDQQASEQAIRMWNVWKTRLLTNAEAVGNLSCVDGCVVLNRRLQLCGFGGVINVSEECAEKSERMFTLAATGESIDYQSFMRHIGGTRHKSAARLCKVHAGVIVLVISQDGEMKILSSDENTVSAYGPIDVPPFGHAP